MSPLELKLDPNALIVKVQSFKDLGVYINMNFKPTLNFQYAVKRHRESYFLYEHLSKSCHRYEFAFYIEYCVQAWSNYLVKGFHSLSYKERRRKHDLFPMFCWSLRGDFILAYQMHQQKVGFNQSNFFNVVFARWASRILRVQNAFCIIVGPF